MSILQATIRDRQTFSVDASPNPAYGATFPGSGVPALATSAITITSGVGPFTHNGAFISGGVGINILSPTTANPGWQTTDDSAQLRTGTYRHTVTDTGAGGATAFVDIPVTLESSA